MKNQKPKAIKRKPTSSKSAATKAPRRHTNSPTEKSGSKREAILALLHGPGGADMSSLVEVTNWQQHSVRGFLAGTVRKKLGLKLVSEKINGVRRYRIEKR